MVLQDELRCGMTKLINNNEHTHGRPTHMYNTHTHALAIPVIHARVHTREAVEVALRHAHYS